MRTVLPDRAVVPTGALLLLGAGLGAAALAPPLFWMLLAATMTAGVVFLAFRHTTPFCVTWLLVTAATIEMTVSDLLGLSTFQPTIAALKATQVALAAICVVRWGPRIDPFNPAWGFVAIAAAGLAHGLYPGLSTGDSLRSLAGSVAPFAFFFARPPLSWANAMLAATRWAPMIVVTGGVIAALAGVRPLFIDSGGARLTGLGHPAFLAGVCLAGVYACLIETYRRLRAGDLALLGVNTVLLLLTGARAPLACGGVVVLLSLMFVPSPAFPPRYRLLLVLAVAATLPVLAVLAGEFAAVRVFNLLSTDAVHLSGRDVLWPAFISAAEQSPWFGWGVGAGNVVIPPDSPVAKLLHTWAAHNEYLRIQVEGGHVGRTLLVTLFVLWVWRRTRLLRQSDRLILRFAFAALAAHAFTDNVLISTPACVLFAFAAAAFTRGEREANDSSD
ncbi:MAG: O-antigen ligase family protein [Acetobacteraceae bacterium]